MIRLIAILLVSVFPFLAGCIVVPIGDMFRRRSLEEQVVSEGGGWIWKDKILLMDVSGIITGEESMGLLGRGENTVDAVRAALDKARKDGRIRAVIIRMDSPGGEVTASDVIRRDIVKFRQEKDVPVVACMMDVAASGAYYIATGCDRILAHPTTITGSIGVVMQRFSLEGLLGKIGVETVTIKSSDKKDMMSWLRKLAPEEQKVLQGTVDHLHARFVKVVMEGRPGMSAEELLTVTDGRIFTAEEALEHKLIDKVGYLSDAIELAKELAEIEDARVMRYTRYQGGNPTIYTTVGSPSMESRSIEVKIPRLSGNIPRFLYIWAPGLEG